MELQRQEKLVRRTEPVICGKRQRVYLEAGRVNLICTMPPHEGSAHYDNVFMEEWRDIAPDADE